jgi:ubiquinone/menaquinone biosynthesis C-methylase UbiE
MADGGPSAKGEGGAGNAGLRGFAQRAPDYAASPVHVSDHSLELMQRFASRWTPEGRTWAVDLGTGAGFAAFALAPHCRRVVATDPTRAMLSETHRIARQRGLANLEMCQNLAEALPFAGGALDLVTCRVAAHHFSDFSGALDEVERVLKIGGMLLFADSVGPEESGLADWMNHVELRRDFSHVENRKVSEIVAMLVERRMAVRRRESTRIRLQFNSWVARTSIPRPAVESLRHDFLNAATRVRHAFEIRPADGDVTFSWPCEVILAVKLPTAPSSMPSPKNGARSAGS